MRQNEVTTTYLDNKRKSKLKIKGFINPLDRTVKIVQSIGYVIEETTMCFTDLDEWNSIELLDGRIADVHFHSYEDKTISFAMYEVVNNVQDYSKHIPIQLKLLPIKIL
jgi:16S rRNA C1402 N4-methylase RsmH